MQRYLKSIVILVLFYLIAVLIICPGSAINAVFRGMNLCVRAIIPSLFPFLICSHLLIDLGFATTCSRTLSGLMRPLFGAPGSGALAVVLGTLSGYPIGAATVVSLYESGTCTKEEGERLLAFCNNAGPLFIIGAVGTGILHNQKYGILLYLVHLVAALITGILFRKSNQKSPGTPALPPGGSSSNNLAFAFVNAITDSVNNILKICGFILFFSVVSSALPGNSPLIHGLLEITGGIQALVDQHTSPLLLPTISALLALSGASILLQTAGIVLPSGLSMKFCLAGKLVQAILSFFLTFLLCRVLPISQTTFVGNVPAPPLPSPSQFLTFTLVELLVALGIVGFFSLIVVFIKIIPQKK